MHIKELWPLLSKVTGIDKTELIGKLTKDAESVDDDFEFDAAHVKTVLNDAFSTKFKKVIEDQKGRMKSDLMKDFYKSIKSEFDIESSKKGLELIQEVVATKVAAVSNADDKLTADNVGDHPLVKDYLKEQVKSKVEKLKGVHQAELDKLVSQNKEITERQLKSKWESDAIAYYKQKKARIFDKNGNVDPAKLRTLNLYRDTMSWAEKDGQIIPVDADGKQLQTEDTYNPISFFDKLDEINPFGYDEQDPTKKSPSPPAAGGSPSGGKPSIKTVEELSSYISSSDYTLEQKQAAKDEFYASQEK